MQILISFHLMRRFSVVLIAMLFALTSCARHEQPAETTATTQPTAPATPQPAAAHAGQEVTFGEARGYFAAPGGSGPHPAILLVHEWWGLDDWIREDADRFAKQGYAALAVDLYRGKVTHDPAVAHELSRGLPPDRASADLKAAFDYLAARPDVDRERIGVIGWCMGGGFALMFATAEPRLHATVVNYGHLMVEDASITKLNAPLLGNFGEADQGIPPADVKAFAAKLTKYGKLGDIKIYPGAGHAFMNPNNKDGYNEAAAQDAWSRIDAFFGRHLRDKIPNS